MKIIIVSGPPGSGKTTYVKNNKNYTDIVYDFDYIMQSITFNNFRENNSNAFNIIKDIRNTLINSCKKNGINVLWLITTKVDAELFAIIKNYDFEEISLNTTYQQCIANINNDETRLDKGKYIKVIKNHFQNNNLEIPKIQSWRHKFLNSKEWRSLRTQIIMRDKRICRHCDKIIFDSPIVHHTTELTHENYMNPEISLNPDLLITVHHKCHDEIHKRFGNADKESIVDEQLNIDYSKR